jgi:integrase
MPAEALPQVAWSVGKDWYAKKAVQHAALWRWFEKFIADNPFRRTKETTSNPEVIPLADFERIVSIVSNREIATLFRFLLLTGLRIGEALTLEWSDIDYDGMLLHVKNEKAKRRDTIPLLPAALEHLHGIRQRHHRPFRYTYQYVLRVWTAACLRVGVKYRLHSIRRTCATMLSQSVSPFTLQKYLRHSDIKITLKYYVRDDMERMRGELLSSSLVSSQPLKSEIRLLPPSPETGDGNTKKISRL